MTPADQPLGQPEPAPLWAVMLPMIMGCVFFWVGLTWLLASAL